MGRYALLDGNGIAIRRVGFDSEGEDAKTVPERLQGLFRPAPELGMAA